MLLSLEPAAAAASLESEHCELPCVWSWIPLEINPCSVLLSLQAKELWPTCVTLCCAVEMCEARADGPAQTGVDGTVAAPPPQATGSVAAANSSTASTGKRTRGDEDNGSAEQGVESEQGGNGSERAVIEKYIGFGKAVSTMGLGRAWDIAPLIRVSELVFARHARLAYLGNALYWRGRGDAT